MVEDAPLRDPKIHVLVLDDEPIIADTLAVILRRQGYPTDVAYCGRSALLGCKLSSPDVLISDVSMPGMNGIEMASRIQQRNPQCKVLLFSGMTGAGLSTLLEQARERGLAFQFLPKPIHPTDLLKDLQDWHF